MSWFQIFRNGNANQIWQNNAGLRLYFNRFAKVGLRLRNGIIKTNGHIWIKKNERKIVKPFKRFTSTKKQC